MGILTAIGIVGAAVAAVFGAAGISVANDTQQEAENTLNEANSKYNEAKDALERQQKKTELALKKLGKAKIKVLTELIPQFVESFNKFKNVSFEESVGIKELDSLKLEQFSSSDFASIKQLSDTGESLIKGMAAGGTAGAAFAVGAGALSVDALLGAGTVGWVASNLGVGAAAETVLAGIGVIPGLAAVAGPALLVGGIASSIKADENLDKAKSKLAQAIVAEEEMNTAKYMCKQIEKRSIMFYGLIKKLMPLMEKSIDELNRLSEVTVDSNVRSKNNSISKKIKKNDYNNLTSDEKAFLAMSGAIAKAVKSIIDTPILDTEGNVTSDSEDVYHSLEKQIPEYEKGHCLLLGKLS